MPQPKGHLHLNAQERGLEGGPRIQRHDIGLGEGARSQRRGDGQAEGPWGLGARAIAALLVWKRGFTSKAGRRTPTIQIEMPPS